MTANNKIFLALHTLTTFSFSCELNNITKNKEFTVNAALICREFCFSFTVCRSHSRYFSRVCRATLAVVIFFL